MAPLEDNFSTASGRSALRAILDGTLIAIDRLADQKPYYSGKHKRHGVNVQVIADANGQLIRACAALPGSTHELAALDEVAGELGATRNQVVLAWL